MVKYKINFIYGENKTTNEIFINVLDKELKKFLKKTCNESKGEVTSSCTYLSLKDKGGKIDVT